MAKADIPGELDTYTSTSGKIGWIWYAPSGAEHRGLPTHESPAKALADGRAWIKAKQDEGGKLGG